MILIVFSMMSIAYMIQVPEERNYNTPRLIRGEPMEPVNEPVEPVEPEVSPLTFLITANLIPSAPRTMLLQATVDSLVLLNAPDVRLVITVDGEPSQRLNEYVENIKNVCRNAEHMCNVTATGYQAGLLDNIYNGLKQVYTEFVLVIQNDLPFIRNINILDVVKTVQMHGAIKYLRFNKRNNIRKGWDDKPCFNTKSIQLNNMNFVNTPAWSDNNHLVRKKYYYQKDITQMRGMGIAPEKKMNNRAINCEENFLFGPYNEKPYIGHIGNKETKISDMDIRWYPKPNYQGETIDCFQSKNILQCLKETMIQNGPKWIDVFHVNHEEPLWRMRFEEHWDFVDEFHVFESSKSHRGEEKPLFFLKSNIMKSNYSDKIVYHEILPPENVEVCKIKGNWVCETHDRRFIGMTMKSILKENDIVIFSDVDEILTMEFLTSLQKDTSKLPIKVNTPAYKYSFHWAEDKQWTKVIVATGQTALEFDDWNDFRRKNHFKFVSNGGWHPSTFGSIDDIMNKGRMSRTARLFSKEETTRRVENGIALYGNNKHFTYQENVNPKPKLAFVDPLYFEKNFMRYGKQNNLKNFVNPFSGGGMSQNEQEFLFKSYQQSKTVFEWGMGSSSALAKHAKLKKLVSVDSAKSWVEKTKEIVNNENYNFIYVDIGEVGAWGTPIEPKSIKWLDYSNKVNEELTSFDVYLVDGRFRIACACKALIHGRDDSFVFIHDFKRDHYQEILKAADIVEQVGALVKLQKKPDSDGMLHNMWEKYKYDYR